ncbi:hypothetical protein ACSU1N_03075 [Thermogladius sp. 4427co]|uniref:hypothetical protein n=1 Tax=Thermogladius sp. 4427co TaxID=3450718 RepID=UPI003F7AF9AC
MFEIRPGNALAESGIDFSEITDRIAEYILEGLDVIAVCSECGSWEYCVITSIIYQGEYYEITPEGVRVSVSEEHPFDEYVGRLLAISKAIIKKGGRVFFYTPYLFARSIRVLLCGETKPSSIRVEPVPFEEQEFITSAGD